MEIVKTVVDLGRMRKDRHNEYNTTNEEKLNRHLCYGASGIASSKSCCSNHESGDHSDLLVHDEIGARSTLRGSVNGYLAKPSSDRPHSVDLERKGENSCVNSTRRTLRASSTSKSTKRKSTIDDRSQPSSQNHRYKHPKSERIQNGDPCDMGVPEVIGINRDQLESLDQLSCLEPQDVNRSDADSSSRAVVDCRIANRGSYRPLDKIPAGRMNNAGIDDTLRFPLANPKSICDDDQ